MTRLEERLGRKLDARDTDHVFYTGDGTPVKIAHVDDYGRCYGRLGEKGDILIWGPDGRSDYHLNLVRPEIKIGDTVRLMPLGEHSWQSEREKEISLVRPVLSIVGHMIEIDRKGDGKWSQWPIDRVQLVARKGDLAAYGTRTERHSCKEPNPSNTPKFGSSRIGAGDFVVSFNTRDEYSEREKITMAPLSLGRVAAVSMDGFTMGVELFAVNGNKIDGPSRPHAPYCTAMLRQAGVDEIEKYGGNSESTPPFVVGDYVVPEKAFRNAFEQFAVCVVKVVYPEGHMLLETVRIPAGADRTLQHTARADQVRRPTIDEWHRDCMNELDVGDVVDLVPLLPIEGLQKGTRFVIERLDTQYWACLKREVFTAYYKDRNGLSYNWPAFATRIVAKKAGPKTLEALKDTIHSKLDCGYTFTDEKRPLKIKPEDKFEAKMKLDADAFIEEELGHLDKPYNPDCMICHGKGYTEELGGKWPCKDCRPEAHKFVGKTKPEPKPKPYHGTNEFGEVVICAKNHHDLAYRAATVDLNKKRKARNDKAACDLYRAIENMMRGGIVTKAQIFAYAEQAELKIRADEDAAREEFHKKWGKSVMDNPKGEANEGKAAGKTLPDPDGQA